MKSCYVNIDRLTGIVELEATEDIKAGDVIISDLEKGTCLGTVVTEPAETGKANLAKISRKATEQEIRDHQALKEKETYAFDFCRKKIQEMSLPMKLLSTEYLFGGSKLLFYFISENRVDFRELVKELAKEFKIRIELRQVGVRDEAKIVGGLGNCGNAVCCRRFLNNFSIVSIKMVKEQGLALNPAKISGICGRLMCCLAYEYETYLALKQNFPRIGKRVKTPQGEGKVVKHNALAGTVSVQLDEGKEVTLPFNDVSLVDPSKNPPPQNPVDKPKRRDGEKPQAREKQQGAPERNRNGNNNPRPHRPGQADRTDPDKAGNNAAVSQKKNNNSN